MHNYLDLVRDVLDNGTRKENRTGVDTISRFGQFHRVDLADGFPLLTTKRVNFDAVIHELLWFLSGQNHVRDFREVSGIWNAWADENGDLETAYGYYWRHFPSIRTMPEPDADGAEHPVEFVDQVRWVVDELRRNPQSRRLVVTAWDPGNARQSRLPPCHFAYVFNVNDGRLNLHLTQRSADIAIGVPFNIASYAALLMMVAQEVDMEPGEFAHTLVDAHVYTCKPDGSMAEYDHVPGLREQLEREPRPLPRLEIARKPLDELTFDDFTLHDYDPHPPIKFKVAV